MSNSIFNPARVKTLADIFRSMEPNTRANILLARDLADAMVTFLHLYLQEDAEEARRFVARFLAEDIVYADDFLNSLKREGGVVYKEDMDKAVQEKTNQLAENNPLVELLSQFEDMVQKLKDKNDFTLLHEIGDEIADALQNALLDDELGSDEQQDDYPAVSFDYTDTGTPCLCLERVSSND